MKVVSLWQPHASLVVCHVDGIAEKRIETRSFHTRLRERVYIHAAQKWDEDMWALTKTEFFANAQYWTSASKSRGNLPFGAIIGEVDWVTCLQMTPGVMLGSVELGKLRYQVDQYQSLLTEKEHAFGCYEVGRFAHILSSPQRYDTPRPLKGRQAFAWELGS